MYILIYIYIYGYQLQASQGIINLMINREKMTDEQYHADEYVTLHLKPSLL